MESINKYDLKKAAAKSNEISNYLSVYFILRTTVDVCFSHHTSLSRVP